MYIEIEKIFDSCIENNLPVSKHYINPTDITIEFDAPQRLVIDNFSNVNDRVTDNMMKVLNVISEDPGYSYTDISDEIGISRKSVATIIKKLKDLGIIKIVGNNKKGYWKIKR